MSLKKEVSYELKHGKNSTFLRIKPLETHQLIIFEPLIRVKNCLPMSIEINLLVENETKSTSTGNLSFKDTF